MSQKKIGHLEEAFLSPPSLRKAGTRTPILPNVAEYMLQSLKDSRHRRLNNTPKNVSGGSEEISVNLLPPYRKRKWTPSHLKLSISTIPPSVVHRPRGSWSKSTHSTSASSPPGTATAQSILTTHCRSIIEARTQTASSSTGNPPPSAKAELRSPNYCETQDPIVRQSSSISSSDHDHAQITPSPAAETSQRKSQGTEGRYDADVE
ncbi:hypothetical protein FRB94_001452 [Tulasnella sp. JGI-2019a]|nr:hypothetical protein FRB94_001452 [Tulasnella sp. JGI-2019a]